MGSCYLSSECGGRGHGLAVLSWLRGGHAAVLRPLRGCFTASAGAPGTSERAAWLCLAPAGFCMAVLRRQKMQESLLPICAGEMLTAAGGGKNLLSSPPVQSPHIIPLTGRI